MDLPAMMRLMVEEVRKCWCHTLTDRAHIGCCHIGEASCELRCIHTFNIVADAFVFRFAHISQLDEIIGDDGIKLVWMITFTRKAFHPDEIRHQQMIEGSMDRAEEQAKVQPVIHIAQIGSGRIEQIISPAIIIGEHLKVLFHDHPAYESVLHIYAVNFLPSQGDKKHERGRSPLAIGAIKAIEPHFSNFP